MKEHSVPLDGHYAANYRRGWRWSSQVPWALLDTRGLSPLDYADRKGWTDQPGWEDGYTDWGIGDGIDRMKWHAWHEKHGTEKECGCA